MLAGGLAASTCRAGPVVVVAGDGATAESKRAVWGPVVAPWWPATEIAAARVATEAAAGVVGNAVADSVVVAVGGAGSAAAAAAGTADASGGPYRSQIASQFLRTKKALCWNF